MNLDKDQLLKELVKIPRIAARISELKLNQDQITEALPILIDMSEEKDDENTKYLTSFYLT